MHIDTQSQIPPEQVRGAWAGNDKEFLGKVIGESSSRSVAELTAILIVVAIWHRSSRLAAVG